MVGLVSFAPTGPTPTQIGGVQVKLYKLLEA